MREEKATAAADIAAFFAQLYPGLTEGYLVISWPDPYRLTAQGKHPLQSTWVDLSKHSWAAIAESTAWKGQTTTLYFGVALQHPDCEPHPWKRSKNATAYIVPGLWCDLDLAHGQHAASALPQTEEEGMAFLMGLPTAPSLMVRTGGGLHAYWLFEAPYRIDSIEQLGTITQLSKRLALTLVHRGQAQGWTLDALGDLARVLRPPSTLNAKYGTMVEMGYSSDARYPLEAFGWLEELPQPSWGREGGSLGGQPELETVIAHYAETPLVTKSTTELAVPHPHHGSSTGDNFNVNPSKGLWHCWRHGTGGDALTLIAVCEGLLACEQAQTGSLRGALFQHVLAATDAAFGTQLARPQRPAVPWMGVAAAQPSVWNVSARQGRSPWH